MIEYRMLRADSAERVTDESQGVMTAMVHRRAAGSLVLVLPIGPRFSSVRTASGLPGKQPEPRTEPLVPQVEPNLNLNRTAGSVRFGPGSDALPDRTAASLLDELYFCDVRLLDESYPTRSPTSEYMPRL
ncbi:hypothetical protein SISNIDRAFT_468639 [Sistotremastrum niveocremeum HHB9708]|uniref:Uncharacterized protein n=1 Tax=Sistotremastrum niveocremeum HHB9708 TaxID=1314777 RepID=A0A164R5D0_9AGAM|nr:hypothetical protein SISNIDRAFT_468639 [Sistotremastrum niveocremeum HHB9708]